MSRVRTLSWRCACRYNANFRRIERKARSVLGEYGFRDVLLDALLPVLLAAYRPLQVEYARDVLVAAAKIPVRSACAISRLTAPI